jgi:hypothetical protein
MIKLKLLTGNEEMKNLTTMDGMHQLHIGEKL